jgi:hypothetical protein
VSTLVNPYRFGSSDFPNVSLLVGADSTITDESSYARALTAVGNAAVTTSQQKYGAGSMTFDGAGDRVKSPGTTELSFAADPFTVEAWCRFLVKTNSQAICGVWHNAGTVGLDCWFFWISGGILQFRMQVGTTNFDYGAAFVPTLGQWYHLAASRDLTAMRVFRDGTAISTTTESPRNMNVIVNVVSPFMIGAVGDTNNFASFDFNGQIDELRITKGIARYTSNFTPPTSAFPRS